MICINLCFALQWRNFVFYEVISLICDKKGGNYSAFFGIKYCVGYFFSKSTLRSTNLLSDSPLSRLLASKARSNN